MLTSLLGFTDTEAEDINLTFETSMRYKCWRSLRTASRTDTHPNLFVWNSALLRQAVWPMNKEVLSCSSAFCIDDEGQSRHIYGLKCKMGTDRDILQKNLEDIGEEMEWECDNSYLTLRRLMSYIYIYMEHPFLMFLDHTQRRSTVGRTPLDE